VLHQKQAALQEAQLCGHLLQDTQSWLALPALLTHQLWDPRLVLYAPLRSLQQPAMQQAHRLAQLLLATQVAAAWHLTPHQQQQQC
jgi:hypothetical protein